MVKQGNKDKVNVNRDIRANEVRVIGPDGEQIGVMSINDALRKASEYSQDLVEISPNAKPPVCKIMDYGRYKYEITKKYQEARKKQKASQIKEIKVRPKTDTHDLETKVNHIEKFIANNDKVKVTMMFRGREITLMQQAKDIFGKIASMTESFAQIEQHAKFEGKTMTMVLAPK